jgi:hypothetical protein
MSSKGDERKRCESTVTPGHDSAGDDTRMDPTAEAVLCSPSHFSPTAMPRDQGRLTRL